MKGCRHAIAIGLLTVFAAAAIPSPAEARTTIDMVDPGGGSSSELSPYLQCVPYARDVTGIRIYGDAHTWWKQAEGRYRRGQSPQIGAVMAVRPHANSRLGHVAAVSRVLDSRTILLRHANWSERGKIEDDVRAIDVSAENDWSAVRIWYGPSQALGTGQWPLYGFIYPDKPGKAKSAKVAKVAKAAGPAADRQTGRKSRKVSDDPISDIIAGSYR